MTRQNENMCLQEHCSAKSATRILFTYAIVLRPSMDVERSHSFLVLDLESIVAFFLSDVV